jgi:hypothetical protein
MVMVPVRATPTVFVATV